LLVVVVEVPHEECLVAVLVVVLADTAATLLANLQAVEALASPPYQLHWQQITQ
jgi:hypothetical protein